MIHAISAIGSFLNSLISPINEIVVKIILSILIFLTGFILGKIIGRLVYKALKEIEINKFIKSNLKIKVNADHIISSFLSYIIYFLSIVASLEQMGLANLILYILAAAVILIILVSFYLSIKDFIPNFLAGIYLYKGERFKQGNIIEMDNIKGELIQIDLLHIKIKTKKGDILYIPNSSLMHSKIKIRKQTK